MATQGERRLQAIRALRALRRLYRTADSAGERVERELDRLIKRKTLVSPDSLATLARLVQAYMKDQERMAMGMADTAAVVQQIPV